jgi:hypothetical protein
VFADEIGADGYGADASNAVDLFLYLVGKGPAPKAKSKLEITNEIKSERASNAAVRGESRGAVEIPGALLAGHPVRGESLG